MAVTADNRPSRGLKAGDLVRVVSSRRGPEYESRVGRIIFFSVDRQMLKVCGAFPKIISPWFYMDEIRPASKEDWLIQEIVDGILTR